MSMNSPPPRSSRGTSVSGAGREQQHVFFGPDKTWGGSSTLTSSQSSSLSTSAPSPLLYNSPTKRFGYTRWPPLISPVPPDDAGGSASSGNGGYPHDDYADVRIEVDRSGHNLTSVMMDPRAPGGVSAELEAGLQEQAPSSAIIPAVLPSVKVDDLRDLLRRTGPALSRYRQNHHSEAKLYRPELLSSRKATDGVADLAECFKQVPGIFFSRDFELSDPALFETLVVKATPDTQEKLTQYLDVVETCLLKQISSRSQHFFEALTTLQDVRDRVAQACHQVHRLRTGLHDIDRKTVMGMIRIPRLAQRKVNLANLLEKLRLIQDVQRSKELVQALLTAGDYMGALDVLEDGRALMRDGLSTVHCMRKLDRQLVEYLELVSDLMGSSFINLAVQFDDGLEGEVDLSSSSPGKPSSHDACPRLSEHVAAQLTPRVRGLVRLCRLSKVMERYRARLTETLKGVVKTVLLEYLDMADYQQEDEEGEGEALGPVEDGSISRGSNKAAGAVTSEGGGDGNVLTVKVKGMEPGAFLDCLRLCFEQMLIPMERVGLIHAFLEEQISVELSRLLDRRSLQTSLEEGPASPSRGITGANASQGPAAAAVPSPSKSTKFKAFLDKRRMETTSGAGPPLGGAGGAAGTSGTASFAKAFKDEDQIKVLELQACKRLNDEVLKTLCDLCQRHIASLLVTRKEAHINLKLADMKTLWDATINFVASMERISGTAGFGLKSTLLTQAKLFVEHMHESYMASLMAAMDGERWLQADVSHERQADINRLTAGKAVMAHKQHSEHHCNGELSQSEAAGRRTSSASNDGAAGEEGFGEAASAPVAAGPKKKKEPSEAVVGDGRYKVVWSCVLLISMLMDYLNVAANFPTLTMDVMQRVVDLLRLFNARTTQLVLGAGAIHAAARLRSITAKHLALASQCLGLVMVLLPHVRAALSAHLQAKQQAFLVELDRIKQEYMEHHEKILAKFVAIIGEVVANTAASTVLKETDWDNMGTSSCRFVEDVIKGVSTMHKVLYQLLPGPQVQDIFSRVFDLLNHRLTEYFEDIKPSTTAGRQRLVDEISHLVTSLSLLRGVNSQSLSAVEASFKHKYLQQTNYSTSTFSSS